MCCILIDAHLSDGDRLATLDVFPLMGIDLFKVSTHCTCPSTMHNVMCVYACVCACAYLYSFVCVLWCTEIEEWPGHQG